MPERRIALIKSGGWSRTNAKVEEQLRSNFPEFTLDTYDIAELIGLKKDYWFSRLSSLGEYRLRPLWDKEWYYIDKTLYRFRSTRSLVHRHLAGKGYTFTFQTQSLFNARVEGVPHFVYTDSSMLANRWYADFDPGRINPRWIEQERKLFREATLNFLFSDFQASFLIDQYGCSPEQVVRAGAGCNVVPSAAPIENNDYGNRHILFVGVDWLRKGGPELLAAFEIVQRRFPDARLTIVGCSPSVGLPNCETVGLVPVEQVSEYYRRASVFCLPTRKEPFGIALIEALAHKLPVVSTRLPSIVDSVREGIDGFLVEPGNVEQLATRLLELLDDPHKCRTFGEAGHGRVRAEFTWDQVGRRFRQGIEAALDLQLAGQA